MRIDVSSLIVHGYNSSIFNLIAFKESTNQLATILSFQIQKMFGIGILGHGFNCRWVGGMNWNNNNEAWKMFVQKHCVVPITQCIFKRAKSKIGAFINHLYKKEFTSFEINLLKCKKITLSFNTLEQVHQVRYNNL